MDSHASSSDPETHAFEARLRTQPLLAVPEDLRRSILSRHASEHRPAEVRPSAGVWEMWWSGASSPLTGLVGIWMLAWLVFQLDPWIFGSQTPSVAAPSAHAVREAREARLALLRSLEQPGLQPEPEPQTPAHLRPRSHLRRRHRSHPVQGLPHLQLALNTGAETVFAREVQAARPVHETGSLPIPDIRPRSETPVFHLNA